MSFSSRPISKLLLIVLAFVIITYVISSLVPLIDPRGFWWLSLTGLLFPWLFILVVGILVFLIYKRSRWSIALAILLVLTWKPITVTFGLHFFAGKVPPLPKPEHLRVLSWNVFRWDEINNRGGRNEASNRRLMIDEISRKEAAVLCFHEFFEPAGNGLNNFKSNIDAITTMGYPYHYFYPTSVIHSGTKRFGMAIFSKYPIIDSAYTDFGKTMHSEGLIYADIAFDKHIIRIFTTHLESFRLGKTNYFGSHDDGIVSAASESAATIRGAYEERVNQAEAVRDVINASPHPAIIYANLGDVPVSHTYFNVRGNMQDAFLKQSGGLGKTFSNLLPNLRVDYLFADDRFNINGFQRVASPFSDHYLLMSDISLKN